MVDDYYANISSDKKEDNAVKEPKKIKLKAKKKVVVVKKDAKKKDIKKDILDEKQVKKPKKVKPNYKKKNKKHRYCGVL